MYVSWKLLLPLPKLFDSTAKEKKSRERRKTAPLSKIFINFDPDIRIFSLTIKHSDFAWLAEFDAKKIQHDDQLFLQYISHIFLPDRRRFQYKIHAEEK